MTPKERKEYILNLDKVVRRWRDNSNLFSGGCCFTAGQIASLLEKKHIDYQVICWQCGYVNKPDLKEVILNNDCAHVAIQVSIDNEKFIIGGSFNHFLVKSINTYTNIKSEEIVKYDMLAADEGIWNDRYNRRLNTRFTNVLNKSVSKFAKATSVY